MSKTCSDLRAFSWGKFSWTEVICVRKLTLCNSDYGPPSAADVTCEHPKRQAWSDDSGRPDECQDESVHAACGDTDHDEREEDPGTP